LSVPDIQIITGAVVGHRAKNEPRSPGARPAPPFALSHPSRRLGAGFLWGLRRVCSVPARRSSVAYHPATAHDTPWSTSPWVSIARIDRRRSSRTVFRMHSRDQRRGIQARISRKAKQSASLIPSSKPHLSATSHTHMPRLAALCCEAHALLAVAQIIRQPRRPQDVPAHFVAHGRTMAIKNKLAVIGV